MVCMHLGSMLLHNYSQDILTTKPAERILRVLTQTLIIFINFLKLYYFYNLENRA